mmetsp:Transcript_71482/g.195928  ORF Transcript_71482/g.195928 Transcript_71482/m.195928 type:complete len:216 (-) Transcript_71482:198-845(-)
MTRRRRCKTTRGRQSVAPPVDPAHTHSIPARSPTRVAALPPAHPLLRPLPLPAAQQPPVLPAAHPPSRGTVAWLHRRRATASRDGTRRWHRRGICRRVRGRRAGPASAATIVSCGRSRVRRSRCSPRNSSRDSVRVVRSGGRRWAARGVGCTCFAALGAPLRAGGTPAFLAPPPPFVDGRRARPSTACVVRTLPPTCALLARKNSLGQSPRDAPP